MAFVLLYRIHQIPVQMMRASMKIITVLTVFKSLFSLFWFLLSSGLWEFMVLFFSPSDFPNNLTEMLSIVRIGISPRI